MQHARAVSEASSEAGEADVPGAPGGFPASRTCRPWRKGPWTALADALHCKSQLRREGRGWSPCSPAGTYVDGTCPVLPAACAGVPGSEGGGWLATPPIPALLGLRDAPSSSTHSLYSCAKPVAPGRTPAEPALAAALALCSPEICPLGRWASPSRQNKVVQPNFPARLKKPEFLSRVAQTLPRLFLTFLSFFLRPGERFLNLLDSSQSEPQKRNARVSSLTAPNARVASRAQPLRTSEAVPALAWAWVCGRPE